MASAPKVQSLNQIIASLSPAYSASKNLITQQQAGLGTKYGSQEAALTATKGTGFNDINNQATAKGESFSGVPIAEQSRYLSEKYLPGMQALNEQQNTESMNLTSALADINKEQRLRAVDTQTNQQKTLQDYLTEQRQLALEREKMAQTERIANADRAASAASSAAAKAAPTLSQYLQSAFGDNYNGKNVSNGWTENVLAGNVASAFGLDRNAALQKIYDYRKKYYGN